MELLDPSFQSCADLQELFQPISPDLSALQLSQGPLQGRLRIINLGSCRLTLLEANQAIFLSGSRRPKPCTIAIPLGDPQSSDPIRAQGIDMPWPGLMGYNHQLRDFDLRLAADTALASLIISKEHLGEHHQQRKAGDLPLERWEQSNQLELCEPIRTQLRTQLHDLINNQSDAHITKATNQLIDSLFRHFKTKPPARCRLPSDKHAIPQPSNSCTGALAIHPKISPSQSSVTCSINPEHPCSTDARSISDGLQQNCSGAFGLISYANSY